MTDPATGRSFGIMADEQIAKGYAESLYHIAVCEGVALRVLEEMHHVAAMIKEHRDLQNFLANMDVDVEGKRRALLEILQDRVHKITVNHLVSMVDQGRGKLIPDMIDAFQDAVETGLEQITAEVVSAVELNDDTRRRLQLALSKAADKRVHCVHSVDPDVIGGVLVRMGDEVIDGSVRRRFQKIRRAL